MLVVLRAPMSRGPVHFLQVPLSCLKAHYPFCYDFLLRAPIVFVKALLRIMVVLVGGKDSLGLPFLDTCLL